MGLTVDLQTRRSTKHLAKALAQALEPGDLVVLSGSLGAGKTFLVRAILRALGLPEAEAVTSPTFALVNEYKLKNLEIWHADLYRLRDASELEPLGLLEARARGAVLLVEWGADYVAELGDNEVVVGVDLQPDNHRRRAHIEGSGRGAALIARMEEELANRPITSQRRPRSVR